MPPFKACLSSSKAQAAQGADLRVAVITGGDHFYSGVYAELADRLEFWLRRTIAAKLTG